MLITGLFKQYSCPIGDYPLSATITSEFAATRIRGRMMTAVFASQGWGQLSAALVSLVVITAFKQQILDDPADCEGGSDSLFSASSG